MSNLIDRATKAKRESKYIEFKESFDPKSAHEWCEIVKDIVAMANSGGGIILFGVDNSGVPTGIDAALILNIDLADITNKVFKYTGIHFSEVEVVGITKARKEVACFFVRPVSTPIVFAKPGTYAVGPGKQKTAFGVGMVYFRHGAKSEPGTTEDIRRCVERQLEFIRKSWLKGVRKVVQAPPDARIMTVLPATSNGRTKTTAGFRIVDDPHALPVRLTRNRQEAAGIFVHEEVSDGIFDEINNVLDANNVLAKGQKQFVLGQSVYWRIYAERQHVRRSRKNLQLLANTAFVSAYSPGLFWLVYLPRKPFADLVARLYRDPKSPNVHCLLKLAVLLGPDLTDFIFAKWQKKWRNHPQPPSFFWTFKDMMRRTRATDRRLAALRVRLNSHISISRSEGPIPIKELLSEPTKAAGYLSQSCMRVFEGRSEHRSIARQLDYLAYGKEIESRSNEVTPAILDLIQSHEAGEVSENEVE